jgi:hypothetical protein
MVAKLAWGGLRGEFFELEGHTWKVGGGRAACVVPSFVGSYLCISFFSYLGERFFKL